MAPQRLRSVTLAETIGHVWRMGTVSGALLPRTGEGGKAEREIGTAGMSVWSRYLGKHRLNAAAAAAVVSFRIWFQHLSGSQIGRGGKTGEL